MGELIWIGNTLLPRSTVIWAVVIFVVAIFAICIAVGALLNRGK